MSTPIFVNGNHFTVPIGVSIRDLPTAILISEARAAQILAAPADPLTGEVQQALDSDAPFYANGLRMILTRPLVCRRAYSAIGYSYFDCDWPALAWSLPVYVLDGIENVLIHDCVFAPAGPARATMDLEELRRYLDRGKPAAE
jgi:hypothetical protein